MSNPSCCRGDRPYTFFKMTMSCCPECLKIIQAQVVFREGKVYFLKFCPDHGHSEALVSEDAEYYQKAFSYIKPGSTPLHFSTAVKAGCPTDCGLCPAHQQHTCLPIVEITDHCNLECPVCIVNNQYSNHMTKDDFQGIIDLLLKAEGSLETITLSGGEPTSHPHFLELVDMATRPEIGRVSVVTNGIRIANSREFCEQLKARNVYVILQLDGFTDEIQTTIRGVPLMETKWKALENLAELGISTQIAYVPARGVNEHQLGDAVRLLMERDHVLSLLIQPFSATGHGGGVFPHDPMDRLTIPGVIRAIDDQTNGAVAREDFIPLPCSHPLCVSLTYLLNMGDGTFLPFPRFVDMRKHLDLFAQTATLEPNAQTEDSIRQVIDDLWSAAGEVPDSQKIIKAMRRALLEMFPNEKLPRQELIRIAERQVKTIFIHHYMDRHDFDVERLMKCCHHYPQIDGRIMPACGFNLFHRGAAKGPGTGGAPFGKGPFIR
ncbi:MAG: radical SAM protein [Candidatus Eremiobacteraeota bacterium]|nr:radical SAM protein [Candidatus Eremiobacteraeota bacterium]